ncbi:MAG: hypothetical protein LBS16_07120, partial [Prevotellaceae bacterium]|nr:hypothetical protein [Prevotellaceae bacterium]
MRNRLFLAVALCAALAFSSCEKEKHFLKEEAYREQVLTQFEKRKAEVQHRGCALFSVFDKEGLSLAQREALQFLYA